MRLAAIANPPLAAIAQPKYEMGVAAVAMLLERRRHLDGPAQRQVFKAILVTRRSTGPTRER